MLRKNQNLIKQFFDSKQYLYQADIKVAHVHVVNDIYFLHGHHKTMFKGVKKTFNNKFELASYIECNELYFEKAKQLSLF
ncbi:SAV1978 family virulence-associated passenger protein [Staphylococcus schweitzeri]|uniref:SAV1978 family virulence-associated passenger protein n=1 Tax=Staphylococcus schweitzeri TaxID=1654388 RepID=UPI000646589E|nr:SAV1978 family virulence-associated passenger protein [Staphylococcus schweitzeri]